MTVPPRLHIIPAAGCDKALVLRRGPSDHVATLLWDRKTNVFDLGQWFKGRIYEHRTDLSPDGRHIVFFAGKGTQWWTALSRAPWLTALVFEPQGDTWHGGGAFTRDGSLWFNGADASQASLPDGLKPAPTDALPHATDGFHMGDMHVTTATLRGWEQHEGSGYKAVLRKPLRRGWWLKLTFTTSARNRSIISPSYALVHPDKNLRLTQPDWEWAEPYGARIQFAERGSIVEGSLQADGTLVETREIKDFSEMSFEPLKAPYGGVHQPEQGT